MTEGQQAVKVVRLWVVIGIILEMIRGRDEIKVLVGGETVLMVIPA